MLDTFHDDRITVLQRATNRGNPQGNLFGVQTRTSKPVPEKSRGGITEDTMRNINTQKQNTVCRGGGRASGGKYLGKLGEKIL